MLSSQVIGKIASIEVPENQWPELIPQLDANIVQKADVGLRQSSLEALGYVCEEVPKSLEASSGKILSAIASGMQEGEPDDIKVS